MECTLKRKKKAIPKECHTHLHPTFLLFPHFLFNKQDLNYLQSFFMKTKSKLFLFRNNPWCVYYNRPRYYLQIIQKNINKSCICICPHPGSEQVPSKQMSADCSCSSTWEPNRKSTRSRLGVNWESTRSEPVNRPPRESQGSTENQESPRGPVCWESTRSEHRLTTCWLTANWEYESAMSELRVDFQSANWSPTGMWCCLYWTLYL